MNDLEFKVFDREALQKSRMRALLQEAGRQFIQKGFHGTSMTDIAKGLKLTKSGLFHYVKTKEELLYLCYKDALESAAKCLTEAERMEGTALDKLAHYIQQHLSQFDQPGGFFIILNEFYILTDENEKELGAKARDIDSRTRKIIQLGIDDGSIGYTNARMAVFAIEGALNWLPKWYSRSGKEDIADITEEFIKFFTNGLKIR